MDAIRNTFEQFLSPDASLVVSLALLLAAIVLFALSRRSGRLRTVLILLSFAVTARYMIWRYTSTLNTSDWVGAAISGAVYAAEIYGFIAMFLFYFQVREWKTRPPVVPPKRTRDPSVDVFVTIVDEPIDILYRTLVGCKAMTYPEEKKTVYVLDDGHRPEVKQIAERLGCRYLTRPDNAHAKAGNLNHAMKHSSGELIVNFDADHVPVASFLNECVGFFEEDKVALVQTPHHFYNPDPYQRNLRLEDEIIHEQDLFFQTIQPGRDLTNSAFYCGSGALFRRSALEQVGGFIVKSVTEDIHTSIVLHANGYRSVYYPKRLSAGLSPESFSSYLRQRQRWARGHAQIFLSAENPLFTPGLSISQRINYFASIYYFFHGVPRVIYLIGPLFYLLFGIPPLIADFRILLYFYLSHYIVSLLAFHRTVGKLRNPFWSDVYETVMSFYLAATAIATLFTPRRRKFAVTPKGEQFAKPVINISESLPQWILAMLLIVGLIYGTIVHWVGRGTPGSYAISFVWSAYNLLLAFTAIVTAREQAQRRVSPRLRRRLDCQIELSSGRLIPAMTQDISESGVSVVLKEIIHLSAETQIRIRSAIGDTRFMKGRVIRYERRSDGMPYVGISFIDPPEEDRRSLIRQMYSIPDSWDSPPETRSKGVLRSLGFMATSWIRAFASGATRRRMMVRKELALRCELMLDAGIIKGVTQDIGLNGASIRTESAVPGLPGIIPIKIYFDPEAYAVLQSTVVWKDRAGLRGSLIGVRFCNLVRDEIDLLERKLSV